MGVHASAQGRMRQESCHEFQARLGCRRSVWPPGDIQRDLVSKTNKSVGETAQGIEVMATVLDELTLSPTLSGCGFSARSRLHF